MRDIRPALLAYLRTCVTTTAIDAARTRTTHERLALCAERAAPTALEQATLERLDCAELWCIIDRLVKTKAERVVLIERFVQDLPPRSILARHPTLFADIGMVYAAIRNLSDRLRRNPDLRRFYDQRRAA